MIREFTDSEYGVILDSLAQTRDRLRERGYETPNIDSAMKKLSGWASPNGCEFVAVTGEDAARVRDAT